MEFTDGNDQDLDNEHPGAPTADEGTLIDEALVKGVQEALRRHKQAGLPIAEWRDGKTVWTPPEQIELQEDGRDHRAKPLRGSA